MDNLYFFEDAHKRMCSIASSGKTCMLQFSHSVLKPKLFIHSNMFSNIHCAIPAIFNKQSNEAMMKY